VRHSHEPDHEHHHPHLENPKVVGSHRHGEGQEVQKK
jgi:hypothetical protein